MAKITISIPDELLDRVERECADTGQGRSHFLRCAAEEYIRLTHWRRKHEQWAREEAEAYSRYSEEPVDITSWDSIMQSVFGEESWEEEYQEFIKKNGTG
jgi:metal-responsive CopG/Arc/MetJ family transcriptional regulator